MRILFDTPLKFEINGSNGMAGRLYGFMAKFKIDRTLFCTIAATAPKCEQCDDELICDL